MLKYNGLCRITRIIDLPCGSAMLVGVGGSGKQSLAKLASFICQYTVFQISVTSTYGVADFKENLLNLYMRAGTKSIPITFLMTDNQIVNEQFLVYINDLLSTGYIADLCSPVNHGLSQPSIYAFTYHPCSLSSNVLSTPTLCGSFGYCFVFLIH